MSVPIYCPECDVMVCETAWGHSEGEYECRDCDIEFHLYENECGGLVAERLR